MLAICAVAFPETAANLSYYDDSVNGPEALVVLVPVGAILVPTHPYPVITPSERQTNYISAQKLDLTKFRGLRRVHNDKGGNPMRVCCISLLKFVGQVEQKERFAAILFFRQEIAGVPVDGPVSY
jgi:hypothetical protein